MTIATRTCVLAVVLCGLGAATGLHNGAVGQSQPERLTTDTVAYCHELTARLEKLTGAAKDVPATVTALSSAGRQMCEKGLTRGGIMRLRTAIVMMMNPDRPAEAAAQQQQ